MGEPLNIHLHPSYHQGQLLALRQMVLALAQGLGVEPEWRQQSTARIQHLHDHMLNTASSEITLHALEESLAWLAKGQDQPG